MANISFWKYLAVTSACSFGLFFIPLAIFGILLTLDKADEFYDPYNGGYQFSYLVAFSCMPALFFGGIIEFFLVIAYFLDPRKIEKHS